MNVLFVVASVAIVGTALALALALPLRGAVERTVTALLLGQAGMTVALLACGVVIRRLDAPTIAVVALLGPVLVGAVLRRPGSRRAAEVGRATLVNAWAGLHEAVRNPAVALLAVVVLVGLAWRLVLALRLPVLDYDGFSYHLVTVDVWLQSNAFGRVPQRLWSDSYPENGELLTLWLMAFTRNDGLATLTGLLPIPLAAIATVGIARTLGARRDWALLAGLVLAATPAVIMLAGTTYVDTLAVADLAAAWYLGLSTMRARPGPRRATLLVLTGVAVGLGVGTKASNIVPSAALSIVVLGEAGWRTWRARHGVEAAAAGDSIAAGGPGRAVRDRRARLPGGGVWFREVALLGLPAVLLGGYWYAKNFIVFGNPMWPFTIGPFRGVGTFSQLIVQTPTALQGLDPLRQIAASWLGDFGATQYSFDTRIGGFGLVWLLVVALAAAGIVLLVRSRRIGPILGVFLPAVVTLLVMPMGWWPRLTLFIVVAALTLAAVSLTRLDRRVGLAVGMVIALLATASLGVATYTANVQGLASGSGPVHILQLTRLVRADAATRADLGLWRTCRAFSTLPTGAAVATDGFNLLHLVVGPDLAHVLTAPIKPTSNPAELLREARSVGATHLAILSSGASGAAVRADPAAFELLGDVCRGVEIVALRAP